MESNAEYFVDDGISQGRAWATYRRRPTGSLQRVKSPALPLREDKAQAEHDLAVWLAERAPMNRQARARRARRLLDRAAAADRHAREAVRPGVALPHLHGAEGLRLKAWHELELGVNEPCHPDQPLGVNAGELAAQLGWPEGHEAVLAAYGQEENNGRP